MGNIDKKFSSHIKKCGLLGESNIIALFKWRLMMGKEGSWPKWVDDSPQPKPFARAASGEFRITYVNHATVLIQVDGVNILTDPVWSHRASPVSWFGPRRVRAPGIRFEDLPRIDVVLLSHNHYDHMDIPTLRRIELEHHPLVLAGYQSAKFLKRKGMQNVRELVHWELVEERHLKIHFVPAQHWSRRSLWDGNRMLWGGFVIESSRGAVYFAGDTGYGEFIHGIHERFPKIAVALLPMGCYKPQWFMKFQHMNPDEAVRVHKMLNSKLSIGIHFGTFRLSSESINQPIQDLALARKYHEVKEDAFITLEFGECKVITNVLE